MRKTKILFFLAFIFQANLYSTYLAAAYPLNAWNLELQYYSEQQSSQDSYNKDRITIFNSKNDKIYILKNKEK